MPFFGFKGGVHPDYNKSLTSGKPTETLPVKAGDKYYLPLSQHIGAPAKPVVVKNQQVKTGELVAEAGGFISAAIHSPVNGKVTSISHVIHPMAGRMEGVIIEADETNDEYEPISDEGTFQQIVQRAGITGMGGATFPTHVKLSPPKEVDTLLINGAECEPYLTCDHRMMLEQTLKVIKGAVLIKEKLNIRNLIIGIEKNKPDAVQLFKRYEKEYGFELIPLYVKYPQGGEKQLIKACVNRVVPEGKLPVEVGVIVHNVGTAAAVYAAYYDKKPLFERIVTVTGAVVTPKNLRVRVGTPILSLIDACGGFLGVPKKIIMGGPMMGMAVTSVETPVMKGTSGILVYREEDMPDLTKYPCIRCGRCVDACPMLLVPSIMDRFVKKEMYEELEQHHVMNCIECGCCSYVCPSRRTLVGGFKTSKRHIMQRIKERGAKNA
ncbi:MAG: electron transport complex subunit RsxC [Deferribacterales bacterium]